MCVAKGIQFKYSLKFRGKETYTTDINCFELTTIQLQYSYMNG